MKKSVALLLAVLLMVGLMAGCGGNNEENPTLAPTAAGDPTTAPSYTGPIEDDPDVSLDYDLPLTEDEVSFTYWIPNGQSFPTFSTYDDNLFYQWMESQTGIDIIFNHPPSGSEKENFQTMVLSNDYPEFIQSVKNYYDGGVDKAIADGFLLRLNELVDQYMPNYKRMVYATEETFIEAVSDAGNLWGIHHIVDVPQGAWIGLGVREDWLTKAGLDVSICETVDGVEQALVAMKPYTYDGVGPLWLQAQSTFAGDGIAASFGFGSTLMGHNFFQDNGTVNYGPITEGAHQYAAKMADWYQKGLINTAYVGAASWSTPEDRWVNGECGIGDFIYTNDVMFKAAAAVSDLNPDPDWEIQAITNPKLNASDSWSDIHFRNTQDKIRAGNSMGVTSKALDNIELALKFWDYAWTEEGKEASNWGPTVGEYGDTNATYYIDETDANGDGHVECYQPWLMETLNNNVTNVQYKVAVHNGPTYSIWSREWCTLTPRQIAYQDIWNRSAGDWAMPEGITLTKEEGDVASSIVANCNTAWVEWLGAVVTGEKSADTFQEVVDQINGMDIATAIQCYQAALDRYNARINFMG